MLRAAGHRGTKGRFDLAVWDTKYVGERGHREQKVLTAIELAQVLENPDV